MESINTTFEFLKNTVTADSKKNEKVFQSFIRDVSSHLDEQPEGPVDMDLVNQMAEYSTSPHFLNTFKNKDIKKNLLKRCIVRPTIHCIATEKQQDWYPKVESVLVLVHKQLSKYQVLELVRAIHFDTQELMIDLAAFERISEYYNTDEKVLIDTILKQGSMSKDSLGLMKTKELIEFGLLPEFISHEKLTGYFKNKNVKNIPLYIAGLNNLISALQVHQKDLEVFFYNNTATASKKSKKKKATQGEQNPKYAYCGDLANFLSINLQYLIQHHKKVGESDLQTLRTLLITFCESCSNLKTLLTLIEFIQEKAADQFPDEITALDSKSKDLSHKMTLVSNTESQLPGGAPKRDLSIDIVLNDLFKISLSAFEKSELDILNTKTLDLFEELEEYIDRTQKFPLSKLQGKIFQAMDGKVGSKCSMAEAKAWAKVITSLYKTGVCANQLERDILMGKANRFLSKQSFNRDKKKMKKEIQLRYKDKTEGDIKEEKKIAPKEETKQQFKKRKQREKASKLIEDVSCPNKCPGKCNCNKAAPKSLQNYKNKVEKYYNDKFEHHEKKVAAKSS